MRPTDTLAAEFTVRIGGASKLVDSRQVGARYRSVTALRGRGPLGDFIFKRLLN